MKSAKPTKWVKQVSSSEMFDHMKTILLALETLETLLVEKNVFTSGEVTRRMDKIREDMEKLSNWQAKGEEDAKVQ